MKKLIKKWLVTDCQSLSPAQINIHNQAIMNVIEHRRLTGGSENGNRKLQKLIIN